jgi:hypothetical protein
MVTLNEVKKHLEKNIKILEIQVYNFDTVAVPRANVDKKILSEMRQQVIRVDAIMQKEARGEEPTLEELQAAIPASFR